jgi:hypothetical protein
MVLHSPSVPPMPDTFLQRASALRARARQERDRGRQRYLLGLASAYDALAHRQGEPERPAARVRPEWPSTIERRSVALELRGQGLSQRQIAERRGVSQTLVSEILRGCRD